MTKRTYNILKINCDCASSVVARRSMPKARDDGARCPYCNRLVGFMDWKMLGRVRACYPEEAIKEYKTHNINLRNCK